MPNDHFSCRESGWFSPLINDYLDKNPDLKPLYNRTPELKNFKAQIVEKGENFSADRNVLADVLQNQYSGFEISKATEHNIGLLRKNSTFTITTGHQLNLFTGPMYFLYKIISVLNLTKELKKEYPEYDFVPVYWMATEDHDFAEINHFSLNGKKITWNRESSGAVGRLSTEGLQYVFEDVARETGESNNAQKLKRLFQDAYLSNRNLADATRLIANTLFGKYGLVILDGDDAHLKRLFVPYIKAELTEQRSFHCVSDTIQKLDRYGVQVNPREINLFYLDTNLRERIIEEDELFKVNNTNISFSREEFLKLADENPEKFSPNVVTRPLYQEVILPNLAYIGGGGELAYWLELKSFFDKSNVTFPMLMLRNSALIVSEKQAKKADSLNLSWRDLFQKPEILKDQQVRKLSAQQLDFSALKNTLKEQFQQLREIAKSTDISFEKSVAAQEARQINGLNNLEKRLLRAEKKKHADILNRIEILQSSLFPGGNLQERVLNFSNFYLETGDALIPMLIESLDPLSGTFVIKTV
ncbi:MAG: bacillithiol biosynthesis cysteine-adding enzyme BshC [Flavobacterium sp.]|nr:MAG: bacillithiol biosynthesis cysteine-adding enzyme BshC [Flavobacterium sp.]